MDCDFHLIYCLQPEDDSGDYSSSISPPILIQLGRSLDIVFTLWGGSSYTLGRKMNEENAYETI